MRMTALYAALSGAFLLGTAALVPAQTTSTATGDNTSAATATAAHATAKANAGAKDEYKAEKDRIAADYKDAKAKCKSMTGNAKDVCAKEAKANEKIARAELGARQKGNDPTTDSKVMETKARANYEVAKEKCDDMKGKEKSACKKQAKADEDKALAEAKANRRNVASNASHGAANMGSSSSTAATTASGTTSKTGK